MRFSTYSDVTRDAVGRPRVLCPGAIIIPWWSSAMPRPAPAIFGRPERRVVTVSQKFSRSALVSRLVRDGEVEVSGEEQAEVQGRRTFRITAGELPRPGQPGNRLAASHPGRLGMTGKARAALAALDDERAKSAEIGNARARICLAGGDPAAALAAVQEVLDGTAPVIGRLRIVEAHLLAGLAHRKLGDQRAANHAAERALALAEANRLALPFATTGSRELLEVLPRHETAHAALLVDILDIMRGASVSHEDPPEPQQAEQLSPSELKVLRYLPTTCRGPRSPPNCQYRSTPSAPTSVASTPSSAPTTAPPRSAAPANCGSSRLAPCSPGPGAGQPARRDVADDAVPGQAVGGLPVDKGAGDLY